MESLIGDQTFQVPNVEDCGGRQGLFVSHENGFQDKVCKTGGFPKEQPVNSLPASETLLKNRENGACLKLIAFLL